MYIIIYFRGLLFRTANNLLVLHIVKRLGMRLQATPTHCVCAADSTQTAIWASLLIQGVGTPLCTVLTAKTEI